MENTIKRIKINLVFILLVLVISVSELRSEPLEYESLSCSSQTDCKVKLRILSSDLIKTYPREDTNLHLRIVSISDQEDIIYPLSFELDISNPAINDDEVLSKVFIPSLDKKFVNVEIPVKPFIGISPYRLLVRDATNLVLGEYNLDINGEGFLDPMSGASLEAGAEEIGNYDEEKFREFLLNKVIFDPKCYKRNQISLTRKSDKVIVNLPQCSNQSSVIRKKFILNRIAQGNNRGDSSNNNGLNGNEPNSAGDSENLSGTRYFFDGVTLNINRLLTKQIGLGTAPDQASLTIKAENDDAPIRIIESDSLVENPRDGMIEYVNGNLYFTTNGRRRFLTFNNFRSDMPLTIGVEVVVLVIVLLMADLVGVLQLYHMMILLSMTVFNKLKILLTII